MKVLLEILISALLHPLAYLLAQPEAADDADNSLRVAFGNEGSPEVVENFARRFDRNRFLEFRADRDRVRAIHRDPHASDARAKLRVMHDLAPFILHLHLFLRVTRRQK